mmetsp:Transcript_30878/g.64726  ORF Transcript_30878/g.64726 Transcript_30878/m.64726 type:complete len:435 (-) Transcript_30878:1328-2632(-)
MGGSRGNGCVQRWRGVHVPHEGGQVAEYAVGLCRRHAQAEQVFHAHRLQHLLAIPAFPQQNVLVPPKALPLQPAPQPASPRVSSGGHLTCRPKVFVAPARVDRVFSHPLPEGPLLVQQSVRARSLDSWPTVPERGGPRAPPAIPAHWQMRGVAPVPEGRYCAPTAEARTAGRSAATCACLSGAAKVAGSGGGGGGAEACVGGCAGGGRPAQAWGAPQHGLRQRRHGDAPGRLGPAVRGGLAAFLPARRPGPEWRRQPPQRLPARVAGFRRTGSGRRSPPSARVVSAACPGAPAPSEARVDARILLAGESAAASARVPRRRRLRCARPQLGPRARVVWQGDRRGAAQHRTGGAGLGQSRLSPGWCRGELRGGGSRWLPRLWPDHGREGTRRAVPRGEGRRRGGACDDVRGEGRREAAAQGRACAGPGGSGMTWAA